MITQKLETNQDAATLVERIEANLRAGALTKAAKAAGQIVVDDAKPRVTAPGYKGDKAGLPALRDSIVVVVRDYPTITLAIVGAAWPDGAHGHLVENGHLQKLKDGTTMHVPPHPWLRPAVDATQAAQQNAVEAELIAAAPEK
ncbi:HK97 gp10 family phage protein [Allorhodopirellula heiligendammensis]|uniref:HK97 gp10 family phage protein n=1 Tax=Allorhodopirellula heiligendammensis TaxID=2714739 RepID=A0A5C6C7T8_9BACT|nr:HK97 gp10 family phage protein [Allorhodopirellula heiligendammensis]TWU19561.1 hypothetical protein Poly21_17350 [Allorhodopirellula heiligendammensis]